MAEIIFKYKTGVVYRFDVPYYIANSLIELLESIEEYKESEEEE